MARPTEYDNLVKIGQLKDADSSPDSIAQFMQMAQDMLADAQANARTSTKADALAMEALLAKMLPAAHALMKPPAQ